MCAELNSQVSLLSPTYLLLVDDKYKSWLKRTGISKAKKNTNSSNVFHFPTFQYWSTLAQPEMNSAQATVAIICNLTAHNRLNITPNCLNIAHNRLNIAHNRLNIPLTKTACIPTSTILEQDLREF